MTPSDPMGPEPSETQVQVTTYPTGMRLHDANSTWIPRAGSNSADDTLRQHGLSRITPWRGGRCVAQTDGAQRKQRLWSPCTHCGSMDTWVVWRPEFVTSEPETCAFSLATRQMKFATTVRCDWPWASCQGCGRESKGKIIED